MRVLPELSRVLPKGKRLIEPFVGSGAVFLNSDYPAYLLTDSNRDLINLFTRVKTEGAEFVEYCRALFNLSSNTPEVFYEMRDRFNKATDTRLRAALFLYLNKHCFNGLVRFNNKGLFNTPFGEYKKPRLPEKQILCFQQRAARASFACQDFTVTMKKARAGDVVYCDPPYVPLTSTANFTKYTTQDFGTEQQEELARLARFLSHKKGVPVIISNHDTEFITATYHHAKLHRVSVRRSISRDSATRGMVAEVLAVFAP